MTNETEAWVLKECVSPASPSGRRAAEPGEGDDDRHQRSRGVRQAASASRDPAVPERQTGPAHRTQSAEGNGEGLHHTDTKGSASERPRSPPV